MDEIDRKIIAVLQSDGRISVTDLADQLPLSVSATSERLRRLLDDGPITGFTAVVDPDRAGRPIQSVIDVRFQPGAYSPDLDFHDAGADGAFDGVIDAIHLTGRFDLQLRVMTRDVGELDRILERLKDELGAEETNTRLVLRTIEGFPRPVPPAESPGR